MARVDPKAKQRKQRIIAGAGGAILLLLVVIQGPKTLKMLKGPEPAAAPAAVAPSTTTTPVTPPVPGAAPVPTTTPVPTPVPVSATVADSDPISPPDQGQLISFESFDAKDPFSQQIVERVAGSTTDPAASTPALAAPQPAPTGEAPAASQAPASSPALGNRAASATLTVNGIEESVALTRTFPKRDAVFRLVSIGASSVKVTIASGAFKAGSGALTVTVGKPVTLLNTSNGKRYELVLLQSRPATA